MPSAASYPNGASSWAARWLWAGIAAIMTLMPLAAWGLTPSRLGDFDHYTLALSWHPAFCETDGGARPECRDQQAYPLLALHGLWPSLPASLARQGLPRRQWRQDGCFHFSAQPAGGFCAEAPSLKLTSALRKTLSTQMPGSASCLERHEYAKHAACFGFAANEYFATALRLRNGIATSAFGDYLRIHTGTTVGRNELIGVFEQAFGADQGRALRLLCERDGTRSLLSEVQIGIKASALEAFPAAASLVRLETGNCPSRLWLDTPG